MIKPIGYQEGYQQALQDFGISDLLGKLSTFLEKMNETQWQQIQEDEPDSIAALLIEQLTSSLQESLISAYLNAIRQGDSRGISDLPLVDSILPQASQKLTNFNIPQFEYGEPLRWKPLEGLVETDFGVVIGRFIKPAPHQGFQWNWKYLILLDKDSLSSTIVAADTAWEDDLERRLV
ncbi:hypothetical protein [Coleofasciculus sp.]|uniref:hypothetical protein n=1 Tax=Coleofasciculus sp. TaxID=3100458 RepID=UPI0039F8A750